MVTPNIVSAEIFVESENPDAFSNQILCPQLNGIGFSWKWEGLELWECWTLVVGKLFKEQIRVGKLGLFSLTGSLALHKEPHRMQSECTQSKLPTAGLGSARYATSGFQSTSHKLTNSVSWTSCETPSSDSLSRPSCTPLVATNPTQLQQARQHAVK